MSDQTQFELNCINLLKDVVTLAERNCVYAPAFTLVVNNKEVEQGFTTAVHLYSGTEPYVKEINDYSLDLFKPVKNVVETLNEDGLRNKFHLKIDIKKIPNLTENKETIPYFWVLDTKLNDYGYPPVWVANVNNELVLAKVEITPEDNPKYLSWTTTIKL